MFLKPSAQRMKDWSIGLVRYMPVAEEKPAVEAEKPDVEAENPHSSEEENTHASEEENTDAAEEKLEDNFQYVGKYLLI